MPVNANQTRAVPKLGIAHLCATLHPHHGIVVVDAGQIHPLAKAFLSVKQISPITIRLPHALAFQISLWLARIELDASTPFPQLNIESYRQFCSFHSRITLIRAQQIHAAYDMTVITEQVRSKLQHRRVSARLSGARALKKLAHMHTDLGLLGLFKHFLTAVAGWECLRSRA